MPRASRAGLEPPRRLPRRMAPVSSAPETHCYTRSCPSVLSSDSSASPPELLLLPLSDATEKTRSSDDDKGANKDVATQKRDAALLLRDEATNVLVPALRSNKTATQDLGSALLQAVLMPGSSSSSSSSSSGSGSGNNGVSGGACYRWGPEQSALLEGLLPLLEEGTDTIAAGLASLTAALVAAEMRSTGAGGPGGGGMTRVLQMCGATAAPARLNALRVLGETLEIIQSTSPQAAPRSSPPGHHHLVVDAVGDNSRGGRPSSEIGGCSPSGKKSCRERASPPLAVVLPPLMRALSSVDTGTSRRGGSHGDSHASLG